MAIPVTLMLVEDPIRSQPVQASGQSSSLTSPVVSQGDLTGYPATLTLMPDAIGATLENALPGTYNVSVTYIPVPGHLGSGGVYSAVVTVPALTLTVQSALSASVWGGPLALTVSAGLSAGVTGRSPFDNCHPQREATVCGMAAAAAMVCSAYAEEYAFCATATLESGVVVAGALPVWEGFDDTALGDANPPGIDDTLAGDANPRGADGGTV